MTEGPSADIHSCNEQTITDSARMLAEAFISINSENTQKYFVSNFDPTIHGKNPWCEEVEQARTSNNWSDSECLSLVSICPKGDARTWLNEWVTSNLVKEFKPLCLQTFSTKPCTLTRINIAHTPSVQEGQYCVSK